MNRQDFINQAIASGKSKEEIRPVYDRLEAQGAFDDSETAPAPQAQEVGRGASGAWEEPTKSRGEYVAEYYTKALPEAYNAINRSIFERGNQITQPTTLGEMTGTKFASPIYSIASTPEVAARTGMQAFGVLGDIAGQGIGLAGSGAQAIYGGITGRSLKSDLSPMLGPLEGIGRAVEPVSKGYSTFKESLSPAGRSDLSAIEGGIGGAGTIGAGGIGASIGRGLVAKTTPAIKSVSKDIASTIKSETGAVTIPDIDAVAKEIEQVGEIGDFSNPILSKDAVNRLAGKPPKIPFRAKLSGVDEGEATVLSVPKSDLSIPFTDMAVQAKRALRRVDPKTGKSIPTPADLVGREGVVALNKIGGIKKTIGKQKDDYLKTIDDAMVSTGAFVNKSEIEDVFNSEIADKLGIYKTEKGGFAPTAEGIRNSALLPDVKGINKIISDLNPEMTAEQLDALSANLRGYLTKRTSGQFKPKTDQVDAIVTAIRNSINDKIELRAKELLSQGDFDNYINSKRNYANILKIEDELSKELGREVVPGSGITNRGASIMKRAVQSNADAGSKALFNVIRDLTGVDLIQNAHYAEIAMKAVGDPRINNLLENTSTITGLATGGKTAAVDVSKKLAEGIISGKKLNNLIDFYNKNQKKQKVPFRLGQTGASPAAITGGMATGGLGGATAGMSVGNTPEERRRNAAIGGFVGAIGGGVLGQAVGRGAGRAFRLPGNAGSVGGGKVDVLGREIPNWKGETVYHFTSPESASNIKSSGYRILDDGTQSGYYGNAISFTKDKKYGSQFGGSETSAKISKDANILNLNDPSDWDTWLKIIKDVGVDKYREKAIKAGVDGVYDVGAGDLFIYNPKVLKHQTKAR